MQLTNNYYNTGYIRQNSAVSVPKTFSNAVKPENTDKAEEQKTKKEVSFGAGKTGVMPSTVASAMIRINYTGRNFRSTDDKISYVSNQLGVSGDEFKQYVADIDEDFDEVKLFNLMSNADVTPDEFVSAVNDITGGEKDFISDAIYELAKTISVAKEMKRSPGIEAYALSLSELNDIVNNSAEEKYLNFVDVFRNKDKETTEILESKNAFAVMQNNVRKIQNNFVSGKIKNDNFIEINVNGRQKNILFKDATSFSPVAPSEGEETECMVKSNLLTAEICKICAENDIKLPSNATSDGKGPTGSNFRIKNIDLNKLVDRVNKYGIENLSSHEIHCLTDDFSQRYSDDASFKKLVDKVVKNSNSAKQTFGLTKHLEEKAQNVLREKEFEGITVDEHFYMRMIDRDLISCVVFDENPGVLSFEDTLRTVLRASRQGDTVPSLNEGNTKLITERNGDNIKIITVM